MTDTILFEVTDGVGVITLNRPEALNSLNGELLAALPVVVKQAAEDPAVRCVVLTGAGRGFCAGGDVKSMAEGRGPLDSDGKTDPVVRLRGQEEASRLLYEMPKPTIAAINGAAVGAGLSLALAADLRFAAAGAKLGTAFGRIATSGDFGGTWLLQRLVGPSKAKELYFLSEMIDAERALALGMVSKVVPAETLMEETMALARQLAAGPTAAFARMKENFTFGATGTFADTLGVEAKNMVASSGTEDHKSSAKAFVEKRDPVYHGR